MSKKFDYQVGSLLIFILIVVAIFAIFIFLFIFNKGSYKDMLFARFFPKQPSITKEFSSQAVSPPASVPDEIVIKFKPLASEKVKQNVLKSYGLSIKDVISGLGTDIIVVKVSSSVKDKVIEALKKNPNVEFAEPDFIGQQQDSPNDPSFPNQWSLKKVNAPTAWDINIGSSSIVIAVIDSGLLATHEDLSGRTVPGYNFLDNNTDTADVTGHGTGTASIVGAATNNAKGMAGMDRNSPIMSIRVIYFNKADPYDPYNGTYTNSNLVKAIKYAADHGASVINMSLGGTSGSSALRDAVNYAWGKGAVLVASSGNSTQSNTAVLYPAKYPNAIAVGNSDPNDNKYIGSNYGPELDVMAPGYSITIASKVSDTSYSNGTGTSYSAPLVSGLAALILSAKPSLTNQQVVDIITGTALDLGAAGRDDLFGWGRVQADKALQLAVFSPPPPDTEPPVVSITQPLNGAVVSGTFTVSASASDNTAVSRVEFYTDGTLTFSDTVAPYDLTIDTVSSGLPNGNYTFTAKAFDGAGNNSSSLGVTVTVNNSAVDLSPPNVSITTPIANQQVSGIFDIQSSATDNVSVAKVTFKIDNQFLAEDLSSPYSAAWDTSTVANGSHTIEAVATDTSGNNSTAQVTVNVVNNICPADSSVFFIQPISGATISGNYTFKAQANHPSGIAKVEFYMNNNLLFEDTTAPYEFVSDTSLLSNGTYTLSLKAYNNEGKKNIPPPITIISGLNILT